MAVDLSLPSAPARPRTPAPAPRWWVRAWLARLVAIAGLITLASAVAPARTARLEILVEVVPRVGVLAANAAAAAAGVLLVMLARGLRRGKRSAWLVTTALTAAATVLHLLKGLDVEEALVTATLLTLLVAARGQFRARADPRAHWRALALAAVASATSSAFLAGVAGPAHLTDPGTGAALAWLTGGAGAAVVLAGTITALRPARRRCAAAGDRARLRELLARYGHQDSLGYFALRRDKDVVFAPDRRAAVAYRVVAGVSLAAGDPVGDRQAWPAAIAAWLAEAADHGWAPAVLGCGETGGQAYRRAGLDALEFGDEALLDVAHTTLQGRPMRAVRQAVARMRRAGYTATAARAADLPPDSLAEAAAAANTLRNGHVERGFSMALGRLGDPADPHCVLVLARDPTGRIRGLLQLVPWGHDGLSLDLMRGDRAAPNGLIELMVVAALEHARATGLRRLSLNFAVFRSVFARGERLGAGPMLRLWRRVLLAASRFWQIESLYRANAKYRPDWAPRYLCFATARDLPRIGLAALLAEAFLTAPHPLGRRGTARLRRTHTSRWRRQAPSASATAR